MITYSMVKGQFLGQTEPIGITSEYPLKQNQVILFEGERYWVRAVDNNQAPFHLYLSHITIREIKRAQEVLNPN